MSGRVLGKVEKYFQPTRADDSELTTLQPPLHARGGEEETRYSSMARAHKNWKRVFLGGGEGRGR